ncbi:hypothetical protein ES708_15738 [subsurface metagenome]
MRSVRVGPGHTTFTKILSLAYSFASVFAKPTTPRRIVFDKTKLSKGCFTETEVIAIILPNFCCCMIGTTNSETLTKESRFKLIEFCQSSLLILLIGAEGGPPAL